MKVLIVGGGAEYARMWRKLGAELTADIRQANLVQFTGGEDVSPSLYGEDKHPYTRNNFGRDLEEAGYYAVAVRMGIPMAGICRGGQFLNVMNGGRMYQHVDGHAISGTHECIDVNTGHKHQVTSTHHQMMIVSPFEATVLAVANLAKHKESVQPYKGQNIIVKGPVGSDTEAVYYHDTRSLCFQPHPEFPGADSTLKYYVELLNRCFDLRLEC